MTSSDTRRAIRVAVGQLSCRPDIAANLSTCARLVEEAAGWGCDLVAFPENAHFLGTEADRLARVEPVDGPTASAFAQMARDHGVAVLVGSISETGPAPSHSYNTSLFFDASGERLGLYRKIHLFDVDVEGGPSFIESDSIAPGEELVVVDWGGVRVGLTICYDLRFPEIYRELRRRGAEVIMVPSAFTERTGRDHWEVLLRARAIENQVFIVAPDQWGHHIRGRDSYGHSMIIDPWGTVLARVHDGVGLGVAELSLERLASVRRQMPCADHVRSDLY